MADYKEKIKEAELQTNINPTEGQIIGGNYKKGKFIFKGFKLSVENPIGSIRRGVDIRGDPWESKIYNTYGYFRGTIGKDGDPIDFYLGDKINEVFDVYIIDQVDEVTKTFDEHKVMFGFDSVDKAKKAYLKNYNKGWQGFGNITTLSLDRFRSWINNKDMIKYPASKISMNTKTSFKNKKKYKEVLVKLYGEVLEDSTLLDLKKQAGEVDKFDTLILEIASQGGSVSEGLQIMTWLDNLSQQGKTIFTIVSANAYSIASLIMLAADYRLISKHGKVLVHNPMISSLEGANANDLEEYVSELRDLEGSMYEIYEAFTNLKKEQLKLLMDNETYLSPQEAVDYGFADKIVNIKKKSYEMTINKNKKINMSKTINILNRVIAKINGAKIVNQKYYDSEGGEIEIYQNDSSMYATGDRTNKKEGIVKLSDGSQLTIEEGIIKSIDKTIDEEVIEDTPSLEKEVEEPVIEKPVIENEVGEPVIENVEEEEKEVEKPVIEKPVIENEVGTNTGKEPEGILTNKSLDTIKGTINNLKEEIKDLKEEVKDLKTQNISNLEKIKNFATFEDVATEAIDSLATNTISNFKPQAKAIAPKINGRSIFQKLKEKRGL